MSHHPSKSGGTGLASGRDDVPPVDPTAAELDRLRSTNHAMGNCLAPLASLAHVVIMHVEAGRIDPLECPGLLRALAAARASLAELPGGDER